jgi:hypothetical protein
MSPSSGFCTNCGAQSSQAFGQGFGPAASPPAKQHKPASGWAKFGTVLFILGVILIVAGPVYIMLQPEAEQSTSMLIKVIAAGGIGLLFGLPLMFRG